MIEAEDMTTAIVAMLYFRGQLVVNREIATFIAFLRKCPLEASGAMTATFS